MIEPDALVAMHMHGRTHDVEVRANAAARAFSDYVRGYVDERRQTPGDDLLSVLIAARDGGEKLDDAELVASAIQLLNAGHEATVHQIGNAVRAILNQGGANRDPTAFAAPTAFTPGRVDQKNVSFGAGIHFCIGAPLARMELQIALKVLFDRLPGLRLAEEPRYRDTYHFHGLESLVVEW